MRAKRNIHNHCLLKAVVILCTFPHFAYAEDIASHSKEFHFDSTALLGGNEQVDLNSLNNQSQILDESNLLVDVYVNTTFMSRENIQFKRNEQGQIRACFDLKLLNKMGIISTFAESELHFANECVFIEHYVQGSSANLESEALRLNLLIPQVQLKRLARGGVAQENLSSGNTMLTNNYSINYYKNDTDFSDSSSTYAYFDSGINVGLWQLRQQSNYSRQSFQQRSKSKFTTNRVYAKRPLFKLKSELTIGEIYTPASSLSSLAFKGIQLESDNKMLANSEKGYAPVVRGMAKTTAVVKIFQDKREIYQTTVAPGKFEIKDLYSTGYSGDLDVQIIESDGSVSSFRVPFSAVPESVRAGHSEYHISLGETRDFKKVDNQFLDASYRRGLTNKLTAHGGLRIADDYQAATIGTAFSLPIGAFGVTASFSNTSIDKKDHTGSRWGVNYSKTFEPTNTVLTLANYRHTTEGFRELTDVLGSREALLRGDVWDSTTFQQKNQSVLQINQNLGKYGQVYVSGSLNQYYGNKKDDKQLQAGYSNTYKGISYGVSYSQQKTGEILGIDSIGSQNFSREETQKSLMFTLSVPLGNGRNSSTLQMSATHTNDDMNTYNTTLSGMIGDSGTMSYALNANYNNQDDLTSMGASINKQASLATVSASFNKGKDYKQYSANIQGSAIVHSGGVTLAPKLSNTFALIEAKGAKGAQVMNGAGSKVNRFGYAVMPSLVPYQYNQIGLDSKGIKNDHIELLQSSTQVAPYAGAALKIKFDTKQGYPVLISLAPEHALPLGAEVLDENNEVVGMIGQGNQAYVRVNNPQGRLHLANSSCQIAYDLTNVQQQSRLIRVDGVCVNE